MSEIILKVSITLSDEPSPDERRDVEHYIAMALKSVEGMRPTRRAPLTINRAFIVEEEK
ncbi:hypothetical protein CC53_gp112 [Rhizobium phage vB_RleS_L338C]|uniref:hypothetical protein n=1 Tax=Rhizobium phage vB_RleS_L338C TaxID=1414737 RepID=UPI0003D88E65|nr:hypothetical protein CC53_gp112 [Rhizobium phage vB_RleS_L338C]AHC30529.1 hypothetical protein L338C_112 [Rhizobium phage vB_RleS_L338C]QNH72195.1 hypothetical protein P11VFA_038 [Rhizobium phage P11VFA]